MNTPIIKISDDQNEITHESGNVYIFINNGFCRFCDYYNQVKRKSTSCELIPCCSNSGIVQRKDLKFGHFKLKHNADTI